MSSGSVPPLVSHSTSASAPASSAAAEHPQGEVGVVAVAVEEVLGVEEDPLAVVAQVGHRVGHHGHRLVEGGPQGVGDVAVPALGHEAHHRRCPPRPGSPGRRRPRAGTPARRVDPKATRVEVDEVQLGRGPGEELVVLGVGPGPSALDVGDAQVVELLGHPQLVVDGERQPLLLAAVAQRRVEDVDGLGELGQRVVVGPGAVPVAAVARLPAAWRWSVDMVEPVLVAVDLAAHGGEVGLLDLLGDRAGLARPHRPVVDRADRAPPRPRCRSGTPRRPGRGRSG